MDQPDVGEDAPVLSVVVPVFNEEECIREFHRRTVDALAGLDLTYELIYVDDGSVDSSRSLLSAIADEDRATRVLSLSRNFGHQIAVSAGLHHARGSAAVIIDADLQDPPEVIVQLVATWREGADVVSAVRTARVGETRFKVLTAGWFYRLIRRWSQLDIELDAGDFRLLSRPVIDTVNAMPEQFRFVRGMTAWAGFDQRAVEYTRDARFAGSTKYPLKKMIALATNAITSFSFAPLQLAAVFGVIIALSSAVAVPVVVALRLAGIGGLGGQTTVLIAVLFFGGVQLSFLGLIGEYVGRAAIEGKDRPLYVIASSEGHPNVAAGPYSLDRCAGCGLGPPGPGGFREMGSR